MTATRTPRAPAAVTPALGGRAFGLVRDLVLDRAAIVLDDGKAYLVEARLAPIASREGFASIDDLVERIARTPYGRLHEDVVEAMTTNETSWFRDLSPFDALRQTVLPQLIAARGQERRLEMWSAACSTGQEPYSVAMLLAEHFPELSGWQVRLLASDLSRAVLDQARAGRYSQMEVNRGLPAPLLVKYFERHGTHWVVKDDIRRRVQFGSVNLASTWPSGMPTFDIVFLRNVMIYFDTATKKRILARVRQILRPDGVLFLGTAETTLHLDDGFERLQVGGASCYRPIRR